MTRKVKRYGWRPDLPDARDHKYRLRHPMVPRPRMVDLRSVCPPVYDQGELGSCTANAIAAAIEFDRMKQRLDVFLPSRLFIYYNERVIEGTVDNDAGAEIRDGIKSVASQGAPAETDWPYDIAQFTTKPPQKAYDSGLGDIAVSYERIDNTVTLSTRLFTPALDQMRDSLASGIPFVFGFTVYESFETPDVARTGVVNLPGAGEAVVGGHAVCAVGYDDATQRFTVRNSWGPGWGQAGYFTMPYAYLTDSNLASDFWSIQIVGSSPAAA